MKTSNKIILTAGTAPILCIFMLAAALKIFPLDTKITDTTPVNKSAWTTRSFPLVNFHSISSKGTWRIHLVQSDDYQVEIKAPEEIMKIISVEKSDQTLSLVYSESLEKSPDHSKVEALIRLPRLLKITMQGASYLYLNQLTTDSISIDTKGLLKLSGTDSAIQNLFFTCNGISKVDLSETPVDNADIRCDGIFYSVSLLMNGGHLKGRLGGIGAVFCKGDISRKQLEMQSPFCMFDFR